jgi:hypothetical protein
MQAIRWFRGLAGVLLCCLAGGAGAQVPAQARGPEPAQEPAVEAGGVRFNLQAQVAGQPLVLNGAGVRSKLVFRVYALALYLPGKASTTAAVLEQPGPKRVQVVMLRDITGAELGKNFSRSFEENVTRAEFMASVQNIFRFGELFAARKLLRAGDSFTLDWIPGTGTVLSINGVPDGAPYTGEAFYHGLLKIWVGERDSTGVRDALLGVPFTPQRRERGG